MKPLELPSWPVVLCFPRTKISTAWAYQSLDELRSAPDFGVIRTPSGPPSWVFCAKRLHVPPLQNDFEGMAVDRFTELRRLRRDLALSGALSGGMTGSGSCFFGFYSSPSSAKRAWRQLLSQGWAAVQTRLASS